MRSATAWTTERILANVNITPTGCWEWSGYRDRNGYGRIRIAWAHRVAYELFVGPIPTGMHLDHLCRNRPCVNPEHLEPVTPAENSRRAGVAVIVCKNGHPFNDENTYWPPYHRNGRRQCRACKRERERLYKASRKEAA